VTLATARDLRSRVLWMMALLGEDQLAELLAWAAARWPWAAGLATPAATPAQESR